jgi:hypothetical protein
MQFILQNIWLILGVAVVVVIVSAWILMSSGLFHRMLDWMRPDSDKHIKAKVFAEDKNIRDRKLKIGRYVISDTKKCRSFYLIHDLLVTAANSSRQFLCLTERGSVPIDFHNVMTKEKLAKYPSAQKVFIDTTADIRSAASKESAHNMMGMSLSIIALAGALVFIVIAIIIFWGNKG